MTWKATDSLTFITDRNYIRDDGFKASGYGIAQYAIYTVNDWLKLVGRGEVWRDNNNFFVAAFPGNFDFVNVEYGFPSTAVFGPAPTTYLELTAGLNISPALPEGLPFLKSLTVRPEVRYDASLNGTTPFNGQGFPAVRSRHQKLAIHLRRRHHREVLKRFPLRWNHLIEKELLKLNELEHVLIEKVGQLFRNMP